MKEQVSTTTIDKLVPDDKNFNRGTEYGKKLLGKSFGQFGAGRSILIDKNNRIIAGNKATEEYGEQGGEKVIVVETDGKTLVAVKRTDIDLDSKRGRELALADNATQKADLEWDTQVMDEVVKQWGIDAGEWGVDISEELAPTEIVEDEFDEEADAIQVRCKRGDVWQLGEHRLMCGDSIQLADVQRLIGGGKIDLFLSDPPYNVDYEGGTDEKLKIMNDKMPDDKFRIFLALAFKCADEVMKKGAAFYIWHADSQGYNFRGACTDIGWRVRECLIWSKNALVLGRQDYQWKHEPCLYGWKDGAGHYFRDVRNETTVIPDGGEIDIDSMKKDEMRELLHKIYDTDIPTTVIEEKKPTASREHPTMKPVALFARLINNSCKDGDKVLDLFGGSGTTIMACEQLGRKARVMELDEHYCDVIIARWEKFTGKTAQRL